MSTSATPGPRFSEQTLADLLDAMRARAISRPGNPGLVASWPGVDERQMAVACAELGRLGYPVRRVTVAGWEGGKSRDGWALGDGEPATS